MAAVGSGGIGVVVALGTAALELYDTYNSMKPYYNKAAKVYDEIKVWGECE